MWREKKLEALEIRKKQAGMRREAYQKLTDFAVRIGKCSGEKEMANATVEALHEAMSGLKMLARLMMQAALFWEFQAHHI